MSQLWLLEAKPFTQEDRTEVATSVAFWLKPGTYVVGKRGHADLPIEEDKSISRKHAEITVPTSGSQPHILLKDTSKYGTWASAGSNFADEERLGSEPVQVAHHHMVKFGFKSPFKLYHQDWVLYLSPSQRQAATAEDLAAVKEAAAATGLPLTDELQDHPGTHVLSLGATPLRIDGPTLLALLRGYPVVGAGWLLEWQQAKVWCNSRPKQAAYPVQLQYRDGGRLKALPGSAALLRAAEQQLLAGHTLLWLALARNAELQAAAALLGAANSDAAASGRAATAAAKAAGAVVVRGGEGDPVPAAYKKLSWTTPELLIAGMLEGKLDAAVRAAADLHSTPTPTKGRRHGPGRKALGSSPTSAAKGRGRGRAPAAEGDEGGGEGSTGSQTDGGEEDLSQPHETHHVMAAHAAPHAPLAVEEQQAPVPPAAAAPQAGGRKRRQAEQQQQQQQPDSQQGEEAEEAVHPTPAKRQKRQAAPPTAARAQAGEAASQRVDKALPAAEGWHVTQHRQQQQQEQEASAAASGSKAQVPQAAPASTAKRAAAAGPGRKGRTSAAAAAEGGTAPPAEQPGSKSGSEEQLERAAAEGGSVVLYLPLVAGPSPLAARGTGARNTRDSSGPNFKAFRRSGGAAAAEAAAAMRPLVPFANEPYAPDGPVDAGAFLKAEAERRRRSKQADELFTANIKARKAAPLPNADGDTPPKAGAKGRGFPGAAATGQQSMLAFMPSAARGRGRGRSKAK